MFIPNKINIMAATWKLQLSQDSEKCALPECVWERISKKKQPLAQAAAGYRQEEIVKSNDP